MKKAMAAIAHIDKVNLANDGNSFLKGITMGLIDTADPEKLKKEANEEIDKMIAEA